MWTLGMIIMMEDKDSTEERRLEYLQVLFSKEN